MHNSQSDDSPQAMPSSGAVIHILCTGQAAETPAQGLGVAPHRKLLLAGFLRSVWPFQGLRAADSRVEERGATEQDQAGTQHSA